MTLFKQIALLVSLAFLLLASIILINDFKRTGDFLQGQLQSSARDMATTLGIAVTNLPDDENQASLEVLFNSIFDSGYYSKIELVGMDGVVIHQKSQYISLDSVPDWFVDLVPLKSAKGTTLVMKGWTQLGHLNLSLHPGFAYSGLYETLKSTFKWFCVLLGGSILALWIALHYLLLPLQRVKEQADAIQKNQFVLQEKIPLTTELKRVVEAMNRMVTKVQGVFNEQEKTLSLYQQLLYHDTLTGLGNRRYLMDHLQQSLSEGGGFHGCLGIIKIVNFDQQRERLGYKASDQLVKTIAELLGINQGGFDADKTARLSDDEFAFLISSDESSAIVFTEALMHQFKRYTASSDDQRDQCVVAAVSALETGSNIGTLLSDIDYSLTKALNRGPFTVEKNSSTNLDLPHGKMQWRTWLEDVINNGGLFLVGQLAIDNTQKPIQKELFVRAMNQQEQVIPASAFMPMASSLGMALEIDKAVFRLVRQTDYKEDNTPLALNLSASFFEKMDAQEEFNQLLVDCQRQSIALCVEASHQILLRNPIMCSRIAEGVRLLDHQFGIDNLDFGQSLQLLQTTRFDYVKVNANTLKDMTNNEMVSGYQALKTMTSTLDIKIIVVGVDSEVLHDRLIALGIEVMQGNYLNEPQAVKVMAH